MKNALKKAKKEKKGNPECGELIPGEFDLGQQPDCGLPVLNYCGEWRRRQFVGKRMTGASPEGYATRDEYIKNVIRHDYEGV